MFDLICLTGHCTCYDVTIAMSMLKQYIVQPYRAPPAELKVQIISTFDLQNQWQNGYKSSGQNRQSDRVTGFVISHTVYKIS